MDKFVSSQSKRKENCTYKVFQYVRKDVIECNRFASGPQVRLQNGRFLSQNCINLQVRILCGSSI